MFGGHDHRLRQTLIALTAGQELAEHESPGEATLYVLAGAVRLTTATDSSQLSAGDSPSSRTNATACMRSRTAPSC